jgi:signal transduction histidine kinase
VTYLFYARLIGFTAGTLVYLFLIALILGHRRPRLFERLLFFLALSLFLIYAGGLLAINASIQYGSVPPATKHLCEILIALGTLSLWPLIVHTHVEYSNAVQQAPIKPSTWICVWFMYLIALGAVVAVAVSSHKVGISLGAGLLAFADVNLLGDLAVCAGSAALLQFDLIRHERSESAKNLGNRLLSISCLLLAILITRIVYTETASPFLSDLMATATTIVGVVPGALLIYYALKHNFLEFGAQRNLVYALSATFLALLYLALVRRVGLWLEPALPPEATSAMLLFILIFLFEPLERLIGPALHRAHQERFGRVQKLAIEFQEEARHGELARLVAHAERRIREEFGLGAARISIPQDPQQKMLEAPGGLGHAAQVPLVKDGKTIGLLEAASTGSYLTGETTAALEFLAEQLPAMVDLCRLIEEKLRLERELAGRERLALLGQMAASVSHNLRNPLSSMKTVLQVQLENPELPVDVRRDCALVVTEIDRMNAKLTQLLHFAKPSVNGQRVGAIALAKQTATLFRHDAERRNVRLEFEQPKEEISVVASEDALSEVLSNLIVNAIEAQPNGGRVRVGLARHADRLEISVDDDGPGISHELRLKIFQPFFTTKAAGTGLGLSIVARRASEMGGTLACESPLHNGKGTRFRLSLPIAEGEAG